MPPSPTRRPYTPEDRATDQTELARLFADYLANRSLASSLDDSLVNEVVADLVSRGVSW